MRIFDDFERTYEGHAENAEGHFHYLNRSARPEWAKVRTLLDGWFAEYPLDHQRDLLGRIRDDDTQHNAAYFELFLYTVFSRLGFAITIHPNPPIGKGNPDFLLESKETLPFYVEAAVVHGESKEDRNFRKFEAEIQDFINTIHSPDFALSFHTIKIGPNPPKLRKFKRKVAEFLKKASWETVKEMQDLRIFHRDMEETISCEGWMITVSLIAKGDTRGNSGIKNVAIVAQKAWNESVLKENEISSIRKTVRKKVRQHGKILAPYVVALNIMSDTAAAFPLDRLMNSALWEDGGVLMQENTRVSAIIAFLHASPSHIPEPDEVYICYNHQAISPLSNPTLRLSQPLKDILGVPANWPRG